MIHVKKQKNDVNDINDTKLDLIKQSSFDFALVGRIIPRSCFH